MDLPPPKDLSHHFSRVILRTEPSVVKQFYKYFTIPGVGNLAGGLPDPAFFPYDTLEARVAAPDRFKPTPNDPVQPPEASQVQGNKSSRIVVPHDTPGLDRTQKIDLATALQYGSGLGLAPFHNWVREFARNQMHPNVPYRHGPEIVLTLGSTDGFSKVLYTLSNPWDDRRDWIRERPSILCEEFTYMNAIQAIKPKGLNVVSVTMDEQGMLVEGPGGLADVLENWDKSKGRIPHLMYTITIGQNPVSCVLSIERKKRIYALCQKFDIIIVEDEPYWFLQFPSANKLSTSYRRKPTPSFMTDFEETKLGKSSGFEFLDTLVPSYLSIDDDGRVVRLDTFSKTIAPGCRLGWITAQPAIIERILSATDLLTQQPSGFVQSMVAELILGQKLPTSNDGRCIKCKTKHDNSWQTEGWVRWLEGLRGNYERRMLLMSEILEVNKDKMAFVNEKATTADDDDGFEVVSSTRLYDFAFPMAGMFLWLRMNFESHPLFDHPQIPHDKLSRAFWVMLTLPKYLVLVAPGYMFCPTDKLRAEKGWSYFRLCFAAISDTEISRSSYAFIRAANDFFDIDDPKKIQKIIDDDAGSEQRQIDLLKQEQGLDMVSGGFKYKSRFLSMDFSVNRFC